MNARASSMLHSVVMLGAGAMGCYFAARIASAAYDVTLVDLDRQRIAQINADGVQVIDGEGERNVAVRAATADALSDAPDLVIVFTKSMHTRAAVESIAGKISPNTWFLTLQNGLGNAEQIAEVVAAERVLCGITDIPADLHPPATVHSHGDGKIVFYDYLGRGPIMLDDVQRMFAQAGFDADCNPNVEAAIWEKVAFNASMNALTAILRAPVGALNAPPARALIETVLVEAEAVAARNGKSVDGARVRERVEFALREHAEHMPSMLQDVLAGRATEVNSINGAIVALGERMGIATPVNRTLLHLIKAQTSRRSV